MTGPRYPWLLPADHPLYHPYFGFNRPMNRKQLNNALASFARRFARDLAAWEKENN